MFRLSWAVLLLHLVSLGVPAALAQELEARAYSPSPTGVHLLLTGTSILSGKLTFDPSIPVDDVHATINYSFLGVARTFGLGGRLASVAVLAPYVAGSVEGYYLDEFQMITRSGLGDPVARFAINIHGAPAMNLKQFSQYRQKTIIGASVSVTAPLGQYDPAKLMNLGQNRWSVKPEIGISRAVGRWIFDGYFGWRFFTDNNNFFGGSSRTQERIATTQFHAIYNIRRGMWIAGNGNFFFGGRTSIGGAPREDLQRNSRAGVTYSLPLDRRNSLKFSYSVGARTTVGGDFSTFLVAFQHLWGGGM
jgi:hypothetical protein